MKFNKSIIFVQFPLEVACRNSCTLHRAACYMNKIFNLCILYLDKGKLEIENREVRRTIPSIQEILLKHATDINTT